MLELVIGAAIGGLVLLGGRAIVRGRSGGGRSVSSSRHRVQAGQGSTGNRGLGDADALREAMRGNLQARQEAADAWLTWGERGAKWGGEAFGAIGAAIGAALGALVGEATRILGARDIRSPRVVMRRAATSHLRARLGREPTAGEVATLTHAAVLQEAFFDLGWDDAGRLFVRVPRPGRRIGSGTGRRAWENFIKGWFYDAVATWAAANHAGEAREVRAPVTFEQQFERPGGRRWEDREVTARWWIPPEGTYLLTPTSDADEATALGEIQRSGSPGFLAMPVPDRGILWARPGAVPGPVASAHVAGIAAAWGVEP